MQCSTLVLPSLFYKQHSIIRCWFSSQFSDTECNLNCEHGSELDVTSCQCMCSPGWKGIDCSGEYTLLHEFHSFSSVFNLFISQNRFLVWFQLCTQNYVCCITGPLDNHEYVMSCYMTHLVPGINYAMVHKPYLKVFIPSTTLQA